MKRIQKEFIKFLEDPVSGFKIAQTLENDLYNWRLEMEGPKNTPYEGGIFYLEVYFSVDHPFKPFKASFITQMYHVNIDSRGTFGLPMLHDNWSPVTTVSHLASTIVTLLESPQPWYTNNPEACQLFETNHALYEQTARKWTEQYAQKPIQNKSIPKSPEKQVNPTS